MLWATDRPVIWTTMKRTMGSGPAGSVSLKHAFNPRPNELAETCCERDGHRAVMESEGDEDVFAGGRPCLIETSKSQLSSLLSVWFYTRYNLPRVVVRTGAWRGVNSNCHVRDRTESKEKQLLWD